MNRIIKFRGKRTDDGEWVFGNFIWDEEWNKAYISYPKKGAVYITLKSDEVDPKTVGQLTGLKDRTGAGIYEGDIFLSDFGNEPRIIAYKDCAFTFTNYKRSYFASLEYLGCYRHQIEIVGNIYDNKELLKQTIAKAKGE